MSFLTILNAAAIVSADMNPLDYVNTLMGTNSTDRFSNGNTLPLASWPWGFNQFAMYNKGTDSDGGGSWWFDPNTQYIDGLRLTHQPSPWIGDWGHMLFSWTRSKSKHDAYDPKTAVFSPHEFAAEVVGEATRNCATRVKVTPSNHGGIMRFEYCPPEADEFFPYFRNVRIHLSGDYKDFNYNKAMNSREVDGTILPPINGDEANAGDFTNGFIESCQFNTDKRNEITFNCISRNANGTDTNDNPLVLFVHGKILSDKEARPSELSSGANSQFHKNGDSIVGYNFEYPTDTNYQEIRLATSLISPAQAEDNYKQEIDGVTYDQLKATTAAKWDEILGAVIINDTGLNDARDHETQLKTFYSSLFRAALYPRNLSEMVNGEEKHWSAVASCRQDRGIINPITEGCTKPSLTKDPILYDGPFSTDSGFWDSYHSVYGLQALLWPERYVETIEGYINHHRENYWIGQWSSPGYKSSMVGSMSDNILADALTKGLVKTTSIDDAWSAAKSNLLPVEDASGAGYPPPKCVSVDIPSCTNAGAEYQTPWNERCLYEDRYMDPPHCFNMETRDYDDDVLAVCELGGEPYCDDWGWAHCRGEGYAPDNRCDKYGRHGMTEYKEYYYIPTDAGIGEDTSRTMNYWNSDAAIVKAGINIGLLKNTDDLYIDIMNRIDNGPELVFDNDKKFFRPRNKDLSFGENSSDNIYNDELEWQFDEFAWGKHYTEGGPWHFRFALMHDIEKLIKLYGDELCDLMANIHDVPSTVHHMGYGDVIHEMAEVTGNSWGQLLHNNQPGHPHLWTQLKAGFVTNNDECKKNAIHYIKKVLTDLYSPLEFPGDEDNGSHGSWYVLSTLGLYDLFPGSGEYMFGAPLIKSATINAKYPRNPNPSSPSDYVSKSWSIDTDCRSCSDVLSTVPELTKDGTIPYSLITDESFTGVIVTYFDEEEPQSDNQTQCSSGASDRLNILGLIGLAAIASI